MNKISEKPILLANYVEQLHHPSAGAVVIFSGESRNHNAGKAVDYLEYESHPLIANKMIEEIITTAKEKWQLHHAFCVHRIGKVAISETAVLVVTLSSHRSEAYTANQYIIDRVKHEVPIWKKEYFSDGTTEWSKGCEHAS